MAAPPREPGRSGGPWGSLPAPAPAPALPGFHLLPPAALVPHTTVPAAPELPPPPLLPLPPAAPPLLLPGALLVPPCCRRGLAPGPEPARAAGAARESSGALRAWLGRHRRNPYPSRAEKAALALASRMSLTQVSTWFANARRRLKKESKAAWARPPSEGDDSEPEPEPEPEPGASPDGRPPPPEAAAGKQPPQPKIWRLAELATGPRQDSGGPRGAAPGPWGPAAPEQALSPALP